MWTWIVALSDTNSSKLRGNQRAVAELAVLRNWDPVEEAIGTSRLEWGRGSGSSRRWSWAHGRLQRVTDHNCSLNLDLWGLISSTTVSLAHINKTEIEYSITFTMQKHTPYLDNGRVLGQRACWLRWLTHSEVLDVASSENDVLKDLISGRDGPISGAIFRAEGTD